MTSRASGRGVFSFCDSPIPNTWVKCGKRVTGGGGTQEVVKLENIFFAFCPGVQNEPK